MDGMKLGPLFFKHGRAALLYGWYPDVFQCDASNRAATSFGNPDDDLVAIQFIPGPEEARVASTRLFPGSRLGCILSAWNFDPPEDHSGEFEFDCFAALVNDFQGINDNLGTDIGVRGPHFQSLLEWQPRVNTRNTALLARVEPENLREIFRQNQDAPRMLVETLVSYGYDAIILSANPDDAHLLPDFAALMNRIANIPMIIASKKRMATVPAPFDMNFTVHYSIATPPWVPPILCK